MARVRRVEAGDLEAVRRVLVDTWHHTYDASLGAARVTEITDSWHSIESLRSELGRPAHAFLLVEQGGDVVATGFASRAGDLVIVRRLYVLPQHQGAGHGAALLDALIAEVGPGTAVELEVAVTNARAIAFYEARGFRLGERRADDFVMRRDAG